MTLSNRSSLTVAQPRVQRGHPGVVDEHVDPAERRRRRRRRGGRTSSHRPTCAATGSARRPVSLSTTCGQLLARVELAAGDHDVGAGRAPVPSTISRPRPRLPPVTNATLPVKSNCIGAPTHRLLRAHSLLSASTPPIMMAAITPTQRHAGHHQRDGGDLRVEAVGPEVVQGGAHRLHRRRAHEQRRRELVGEQHEHQRRGAAERRAQQRQEDLEVRAQHAGAADPRRLDVRVAERDHAGHLHPGRERQHQRHVHEDDHPAAAVEDRAARGCTEQEAGAEDDGRDAERHRHDEVERRCAATAGCADRSSSVEAMKPTGRAMATAIERDDEAGR